MAFLILAVHYFLDSTFTTQTGILNEEEYRHAVKSLRLTIGAKISIGDGKGNRHLCAIKAIGKKELVVDVLSTSSFEILTPQLIIAIAPTKNPSRFEWFLEKATELGVAKIIPIESKRTEKLRFKHERGERIIHAAAKQSMRAFIPVLESLTPLSEVLSTNIPTKLIAHCDKMDEERIDFKDFLTKNFFNEILVLIGPEGDFTPDEVSNAKETGFQSVILGKNRLRTETAGVFVAAVFFE